MTDKAEDIARGIAENLIHQHLNQHECFARCLATTLMEYGEARGKETILSYAGKHPLIQCFCAGKLSYVAELCRGCHCRIGYEWEQSSIEDMKKQADAEGYQRGKAESCVAEFRRGMEACVDEIHRLSYSSEIAAHLWKLSQRGQEGSK